MNPFIAFLKLVIPSILLFFGLVCSPRGGEITLVTVGVIGVAFAWLIVAVVDVAKRLHAPAEGRPGPRTVAS